MTISYEIVRQVIVPLLYLLSAVLFVVGLKRLSKVRTARRGNAIAALGMLLAVVGSLLELGLIDYRWIVGGVAIGGAIGVALALKVPMTAMPEMVALFNGFGGLASALVALSVVWLRVLSQPAETTGTLAATVGTTAAVTIFLSVLIGALTLTGSLIALLKLQNKLRKGAPILLPGRHAVNLLLGVAVIGVGAWLAFVAPDRVSVATAALTATGIALVLGVLLVIPIGGADMPVVVSLLNSYSGMAAAAAGFVIGNPVLIIAGSMVGAAGLILTKIMCVAMNRSLANVLVGGFGVEGATPGGGGEYKNVTSADAEEMAMLLESASNVVFVPGYGMAVAQAQHAVRELAGLLEKRGANVQYAIHPVAGRMPGHMNVLLAEADVPYEQLVEMDAINPQLKNTDVVIVLGANDVVNPAALHDRTSPIYGMPIIEVHQARSVFVIKRSLGAGYAGIKNELFEGSNTMMVFGDARKVMQQAISELKELSAAA